MKKLILLTTISLLTLTYSSLQSQAIAMTFTTGISPQLNPVSHYIFVNRSKPIDEFTFDLAQVKSSYFIGVGIKYDLHPFFLATEAQYNRREYVYNVEYTYPGFGRSEQIQQMTESMQVINVPINLGVDLGVIDITSGFLPQIVLSNRTDLQTIPGYSQNLKWLRFGWQSGVAAELGNVRLGVSMQMDFNNYADHAKVNNENLALAGQSTRMLGTIGYQF